MTTPTRPPGYREPTAEQLKKMPPGSLCLHHDENMHATWEPLAEFPSQADDWVFLAYQAGQLAVPDTEATKPSSPLAEQVGGDHYKTLAIQPVEYCQKNRLGYIESNVVKYVTRHRAKNGRQDIEKAIHNLNILLEMEYPIP